MAAFQIVFRMSGLSLMRFMKKAMPEKQNFYGPE